MTYLVTGGAGFIGGHLAEALLQRGERVVIIDNFNDYYDPAIKRQNAARLNQYDSSSIIEGDIRDLALVDRLFAEHGISHVAHLAAMAGVREKRAAGAPLHGCQCDRRSKSARGGQNGAN